MRWIETPTGYVNLAHATRITRNEPRTITDQKGNTREIDGGWSVWGKDGEHYNVRYMTEDRLERLLAPIVPASGNQKLHVVWYAPGEPETWIEVFDIVGWRVLSHNQIEPIALDYNPDSNCVVVVERPDGKFTEAVYEGATFNSIDEVVRLALTRMKLSEETNR